MYRKPLHGKPSTTFDEVILAVIRLQALLMAAW